MGLIIHCPNHDDEILDLAIAEQAGISKGNEVYYKFPCGSIVVVNTNNDVEDRTKEYYKIENIKKILDDNEIKFFRNLSRLSILKTLIWSILSCIIGYYTAICSRKNINYISAGIFSIFVLSVIVKMIYQKLYNNLIKNEYKSTRELLSQITDEDELKALKHYCNQKLHDI